MSVITLVRHGQANTGATDEDSYDNLSALGHEQASWMADWVAGTAYAPERVIAGPLNRQRQTAEIVAQKLDLPLETDERLREMDYFGLSQSVERTHAMPLPMDRPGFMSHIPQIMNLWAKGEIDSPVESFDQFANRVLDAMKDAEADSRRVMLVTSGGVVSVAVRHILSLDMGAFAHMMMQVHNSSLHRYVIENGERRLDNFNATPHLDSPERVSARTYT